MLLADCKVLLNLTGTDFYDGEIQDIILAAAADLAASGIDTTELYTDIAGDNIASESDPLLKQAVKSYVRGHFGTDDDSEKYCACYENLRQKLMLNPDYKAADNV